MAGEDIIPSLGLDTSGFDAGLAAANARAGKFSGDVAASVGRADGAVVKLGKSTKTLAQPIKAAADSTAHLRSESEKLEKVASLLGPKVGGVVSMMSKLGKTAGSDIGGATFAIVGLGAGAGAAVAALTAFGSMVANTITNIDEMAASLTDLNRRALGEQIAAVKDAKNATDDLGRALNGLQIVIAAQAAPAVSDFSVLLADVTDHISGADDAVGTESSGFLGALVDTATWLLSAEADMLTHGAFTSIQEGWKIAADLVHEYANASRKAASAPGGGSVPQGTGPLMPAKPITTADLTFDFAGSASSPIAQRGASNRAPSGPDASMSFNADEVDFSGASFAGYAEAQAFADAAAGYADDTKAYGVYIGNKIKQSDKLRDAEIANEEAVRAARQQSTADAIDMAGAMANVLGSLATGLTDLQVENTEEGTAAHRKALRDQFIAQKAAALASIAINTAVGFTQDLAKGGVVGIILGAATLLAGGVQAGLVLGTQAPKMHTGGLAPDERYGMPQPITRNNERTAVLTQEGQRHLNELDRINAGAMGGGQILQVVVRDDSGRRMSGRQFARPDPGVGFATRAVRS